LSAQRLHAWEMTSQPALSRRIDGQSADEDAVDMSDETRVGPVEDLPPNTVTGAGHYVVGNVNGEVFALSRRCRHLGADLANGSLDDEGRLVCPWHQSAYDVETGRMLRGPQGVFAKIPGLGAMNRALTKVWPLRRREVAERGGCLYVH
jgi:nitrite reductase/ring-hydroxylating ferredoxin subunit